jgi:ATP-dependent Clp protease ATP-binding subunit ClpA
VRRWPALKVFSDLYCARAVTHVVSTEVLLRLVQKLFVGMILDRDTVEICVEADGTGTNHTMDEQDIFP